MNKKNALEAGLVEAGLDSEGNQQYIGTEAQWHLAEQMEQQAITEEEVVIAWQDSSWTKAVSLGLERGMSEEQLQDIYDRYYDKYKGQS